MTTAILNGQSFDMEEVVVCPLSGRPLLVPSSKVEERLVARAVPYSELPSPPRIRSASESGTADRELVFIHSDAIR